MRILMNWKIFISLLFIASILISGCIFNEKQNNKKNNTDIKEHSCTFGIEIKLNNYSYFNIKIPIAVNQNGSINEVMNNLAFKEGSGKFSIIKIADGFVLNLTGNTNMIIENTISVVWNKDQYPILSLRKNGTSENEYTYQIFLEKLNSTNYINIHIYLATHFSYNNYDEKYQFDIKNIIYPPSGRKDVEGNFKIAKS